MRSRGSDMSLTVADTRVPGWLVGLGVLGIRQRHAAPGFQPATPIQQGVHGVRSMMQQGVVCPAPLTQMVMTRVVKFLERAQNVGADTFANLHIGCHEAAGI